MHFTHNSLSLVGFEGFEKLLSLASGATHVPAAPGVYVVLGTASAEPDLLTESRGGLFKGRNPTAGRDTLMEKWVPGTEVLYAGKAKSLRRRLIEFAKFGNGHPAGHWGGRYLWQLADCEGLVVAWKTVDDPWVAERELIEAFETQYGRLPFANLVRGRRQLATD